MRCEEVSKQLPVILDDGSPADIQIIRHIDSCESCAALLADYKLLLRLLRQARSRIPQNDGWLGEVLGSVEREGERRLRRLTLARRDTAYLVGASASLVLMGIVGVGVRTRNRLLPRPRR